MYKSVTAKALEPSQVIRLPMKALKEVFDENPDMLVRVVQIIMIRLQRVIFTALRNYLGLYSELVQVKPDRKDRKPQQAQASNTKNSPTHHKPRASFAEANFIHTLSFEQSDLVRPDMLNDLSEVMNIVVHEQFYKTYNSSLLPYFNTEKNTLTVTVYRYHFQNIVEGILLYLIVNLKVIFCILLLLMDSYESLD